MKRGWLWWNFTTTAGGVQKKRYGRHAQLIGFGGWAPPPLTFPPVGQSWKTIHQSKALDELYLFPSLQLRFAQRIEPHPQIMSFVWISAMRGAKGTGVNKCACKGCHQLCLHKYQVSSIETRLWYANVSAWLQFVRTIDELWPWWRAVVVSHQDAAWVLYRVAGNGFRKRNRKRKWYGERWTLKSDTVGNGKTIENGPVCERPL